jgi:hypothetical protein
MGCFAQEKDTIQSDTNFIIVELVTAHYHFNIDVDSYKFPTSFEGFTNIKPPVLTPYNQVVDGSLVGRKETIRYILKPNEVGPYIIDCPVYYIFGTKIKGWNKLTITRPNTPNGGEVRIFNPEEMYRFVLGNEYEEIEKYFNSSLEFYRILTKTEFKALEKINKKIKD